MNILHMVNTMEFKIALLRHYIAQAFIDAMCENNNRPVYLHHGTEIPLTSDRVSANIAYYIERENILDYGISHGQAINAERLYSMLRSHGKNPDGGHGSMKIVSETTQKANGHWPLILQAQGIAVPAYRQHGACPHCGGKDRFRFDDKAGRGTWFCNQCGNGDGLDLVCLVSGLDKVGAATAIAKALSLTPQQRPGKAPARKEDADVQNAPRCKKTIRHWLKRRYPAKVFTSKIKACPAIPTY